MTTVTLENVVRIWEEREQGRPSTKWALDDLWKAACAAVSGRETRLLNQDVASLHYERLAREAIHRFNQEQETDADED